ncbi:MAG: hydrogenase expression/formation protein HypE [Bacillota bacterium]|jgi:hydrogenase expression/formation protein HypE
MSQESECKRVLLSHGDGGVMTGRLVREIFVSQLGNPFLSQMDDATRLHVEQGDLLFTTDSFVVDPMFFPGGDIGKLAICGTANDLWVAGAIPKFFSVGFIIEEGTLVDDLAKIARSMAREAAKAGIMVVAGDTKVVPRGKGDGVFINTSGIGILPLDRRMSRRTLPGDRVVVSGTIGEHGLVILAHRLGIPLGDLTSDCGLVGHDVDALLSSGVRVTMMRDPTRGGVGSVLKEVAVASGCDVLVHEDLVPVKDSARDIADLLGVDPLYLPCEGRVVAFVGPGEIPSGWTVIGEVRQGKGDVFLQTGYGGVRRLGLFEGMPLPRIC